MGVSPPSSIPIFSSSRSAPPEAAATASSIDATQTSNTIRVGVLKIETYEALYRMKKNIARRSVCILLRRLSVRESCETLEGTRRSIITHSVSVVGGLITSGFSKLLSLQEVDVCGHCFAGSTIF